MHGVCLIWEVLSSFSFSWSTIALELWCRSVTDKIWSLEPVALFITLLCKTIWLIWILLPHFFDYLVHLILWNCHLLIHLYLWSRIRYLRMILQPLQINDFLVDPSALILHDILLSLRIQLIIHHALRRISQIDPVDIIIVCCFHSLFDHECLRRFLMRRRKSLRSNMWIECLLNEFLLWNWLTLLLLTLMLCHSLLLLFDFQIFRHVLEIQVAFEFFLWFHVRGIELLLLDNIVLDLLIMLGADAWLVGGGVWMLEDWVWLLLWLALDELILSGLEVLLSALLLHHLDLSL